MFKNVALVAALMAVFMLGCGESEETGKSGDTSTDTSTASSSSTTGKTTPVAFYCGKCGHQADADHLCDTECEKCDCGLHKGSDMCCKVPDEMKGKDICSCGYVKGSENCCQEGADKCEKCHMIKGSDMCCKIPHTHEGEEGHSHDHDGDKEGEE